MPQYFLKEVKQEKQLNFVELEHYIRELQQSGFDTIRLQVQFHKKFSVPLCALIMALLSIPFAFLTGSRGAMAGVGVSFGIAISYWALRASTTTPPVKSMPRLSPWNHRERIVATTSSPSMANAR